MKKIIFFVFTVLCVNLLFAQTTAIDFTATDCNNTSHNLFTELNSGKVIVLTWVMPCGACINPALTASSVVEATATSHLGKVVFYMADDLADDNCATISAWGAQNGITNATYFSNASIRLSDYGSYQMNKTVVLAGSNHAVFYNVSDVNIYATLQAAINQAIVAAGVEQISGGLTEFNIHIGLNNKTAILDYSLIQQKNVTIDIVNNTGKKIEQLIFNQMAPGKHEVILNIENYKNGIYFFNIQSDKELKTLKLAIIH